MKISRRSVLHVSGLAAAALALTGCSASGSAALGGGVSGAPDSLLLRPLRRLVAENCFGRRGNMYPQIVRAELGNDAGIIGAALLHRAV